MNGTRKNRGEKIGSFPPKQKGPQMSGASLWSHLFPSPPATIGVKGWNGVPVVRVGPNGFFWGEQHPQTLTN